MFPSKGAPFEVRFAICTQYLADFANAKQTGKRKEGSAQGAETGVTLVEGQSHTFSFAVRHARARANSPSLASLSVVQVEDFVHELCEGIMEETLLNVGVIYITLYSGETEVERFPFVTHVRRCALMHPPPNDIRSRCFS